MSHKHDWVIDDNGANCKDKNCFAGLTLRGIKHNLNFVEDLKEIFWKEQSQEKSSLEAWHKLWDLFFFQRLLEEGTISEFDHARIMENIR